MEISSWILFFFAGAAWCSVRHTFPLTETHRRVMWISALALMALPAFTGLADNRLVTALLWPFLAGVMAGEVGWTRLQRWRVDRQAAAERAKAEAKKRARTKKKATHED